jgi:hypothetical protein
MNGDLYMLDGHTPLREEDVLKWAGWYETADTRVAQTAIGPLEVSTVFIGLDHGRGAGPPKLFETVVFKGNEIVAGPQRCSTWDQAEAQHAAAVAEVKARGA